MAIQHGVNVTASDMAAMVEQGKDATGKKSWELLYGNAGLNYQTQSDALLKTYGDTIAEAYKSSLQQQNALYDLGLTQGDTKDLQGFVNQELMATYQNYLSNYKQAQNDLDTAYMQQKGLYDEALMSEAENFASLYNSAMDYYENVLKDATYTTNDLSKPIYSGEGKEAQVTGDYEQKTTSLVDEYGLDWLMKQDADGNMIALGRDELMNKMFDQEGGITEYGRSFYDMIFNHAATADGYTDIEGNPIVSFDEWLSANNSDLYEWTHSADTFNYTHQGTKLGTAKEFVGLDSTDDTFEYVGNKFSDKFVNQITTIFDDAQKALDELKASGMDTNNLNLLDETKNIYDEMLTEIESGLGENYEKYRKDFEALRDKYLDRNNFMSTYFPTYFSTKGSEGHKLYMAGVTDMPKLNDKILSFKQEFMDLVKRAYAGK